MPRAIAPVLVVNWGDYDNEKLLWDSLAKIMTGEKATPHVFIVDEAKGGEGLSENQRLANSLRHSCLQVCQGH